MKSARIASLALLALLIPSACTLVPLKMPAPMTYEVTQDQARDMILNVLRGRGWIPVSDELGVICARISLREHIGELSIHYSAEQIIFEHIGSSGLSEGTNSAGDSVIHKNYISWVENLRTDLEFQLSATLLQPSQD